MELVKYMPKKILSYTVTSFTNSLWSVVKGEALQSLRCNLDDEY